MSKRRATRTVVLSDADRLAHVHPRRLREAIRASDAAAETLRVILDAYDSGGAGAAQATLGDETMPTHVCDSCDAEFIGTGKAPELLVECPLCQGRLVEIPEFVPNAETVEAIRAAGRGEFEGEYATVDELMDELHDDGCEVCGYTEGYGCTENEQHREEG